MRARLSPRVRFVLARMLSLSFVQALLAHVTPAGFETVAEELETFPRLPAVADESPRQSVS
jgi:hypothetical protein